MTRYVAFLRGINVGGSNKISMPQLRGMAESLGYGDVRSYINSGNLLFTSTGSDSALTTELQQAIQDEFGLTIDVAVRTEAQLRKVLGENPWPDAEPSQVTVAFLTKKAGADAEERLAAVAAEHETYRFAGLEIWVDYAGGLAKSKLATQFIKVIGVSATVRNVRTVGKIVAMFD